MAYRYKTVKIDGKTKLLHRHLMEQRLGRVLFSSEHVHHRNENEHDNRPENLEILSAQQHAELHKQKHPRIKTCAVCGDHFEPHPTKRKRALTCSKACSYTLRWRTRRAA